MKRYWPFISFAAGTFLMFCGLIYYVAFAGLRYEVPREEIPAAVAVQAHISFAISWLGTSFLLFGLLGISVRLIQAAQLRNEAGKIRKAKLTWIALTAALVITILCIICLMSAGFFIFGTLAVVSAWLMHPAMWLSNAVQHFSGDVSLPRMALMFIFLFIQCFAITWLFMWFVICGFRSRNAWPPPPETTARPEIP